MSDLSWTVEYKIESAKLTMTELILEEMKRIGMSRKEFAEALGVQPSAVTKMLKGRNNFTFETAVKLCDAVGLRFVPSVESQPQPTLKTMPKKKNSTPQGKAVGAHPLVRAYRISGACLVPATATIEVEAENAEQALAMAREKFKANPRGHIEGNSYDDTCAFDWEPFIS